MKGNLQLNYDQQTLVVSNLEYAKRLATKFYRTHANCGLELDDCVAAAYCGLCEAAKRFDPSVDVKFRTFSFSRIRGAIYDLMRNVMETSRGNSSCFRMSLEGFGRDDFYNELSTGFVSGQEKEIPYQVSVSLLQLSRLAQVIEQTGVKLHCASFDSAELSYANEISPEQYVASGSVKKYLARLLNQLPEHQRELLRMRYFEDFSYEEIRELFEGVSKSWLSKIHGKAIDTLREQMIQETRLCAMKVAAYER